MAKTTAPLLSFDAAGQIGNSLVFGSWKGRSYARRYVIPANPNTAEQQLTRGTFSWLNNVMKYMPAGAIAGWNAYANTNRFTARNGFIKLNLSNLREEADLANMIFSPSARGGVPPAAIGLTAGDDQITVDVTAPEVPEGWTIAAAHAIAIQEQDPQTGVLYTTTYGSDATSTYQIILTGLESAVEYRVGAWFSFNRPDGLLAYGQSISDTATTT